MRANLGMICQFKVIRLGEEASEMKLVAARKLTGDEPTRLIEMLAVRVRHPFNYAGAVLRSEDGKFENYRDETACS